MSEEQKTTVDLKDWSHRVKQHHSDIELERTTRLDIDKIEKHFSYQAFIIKLVVLAVIIASLYFDYIWLFANSTPEYKNILLPMNLNQKQALRIEKYVRYLVRLYRSEKMHGLELKWTRNIPPEFKTEANQKFAMLSREGFTVDRIAVEKNRIYNIRCHTLGNIGEIAYIEIMMVNIGGNWVFRLLRVY